MFQYRRARGYDRTQAAWGSIPPAVVPPGDAVPESIRSCVTERAPGARRAVAAAYVALIATVAPVDNTPFPFPAQVPERAPAARRATETAYHIATPIPPADFTPELSAPVVMPERATPPPRARAEAYWLNLSLDVADELPNPADYTEIAEPQRTKWERWAAQSAYWVPSYWIIGDNPDLRTFPAYMPERAPAARRADASAYQIGATQSLQFVVQSEPPLQTTLPDRAPRAPRAPGHTYWLEQQRHPFDPPENAATDPEIPERFFAPRRAAIHAYQISQQFVVDDQPPVDPTITDVPLLVGKILDAGRRGAITKSQVITRFFPDEPTIATTGTSIPDKTRSQARAGNSAYWIPQLAGELTEFDFPVSYPLPVAEPQRRAQRAPASAYQIAPQLASEKQPPVEPSLSQPQLRKRTHDAYQIAISPPLSASETPQGVPLSDVLPRPKRAPLAAYWIDQTSIESGTEYPVQPAVAQPQRSPKRAAAQAYQLAAFTPQTAPPVTPTVSNPVAKPRRAPASAYQIGSVTVTENPQLPVGKQELPDRTHAPRRAKDHTYWIANDRVLSNSVATESIPTITISSVLPTRRQRAANEAYWIPSRRFAVSDEFEQQECDCPLLPIPDETDTELPKPCDETVELPRTDDTDGELPRIDQCEC